MTPRKPAERGAGLGERPGRAGDVVQPRPGSRPILAEPEAVARAVVEAGQLDAAVVGRQVGDADLEVDRRRQDVAQVVVGVLADEVDAAGRPDHPDLAAARVRGGLGGDEGRDEGIGLELCRRQHEGSVAPWHHRDMGISAGPAFGRFETVVLENRWVRVVVCPVLGGRVLSMLDRSTDREWLLQGDPPAGLEAWAAPDAVFGGLAGLRMGRVPADGRGVRRPARPVGAAAARPRRPVGTAGSRSRPTATSS